MNKWLKLVARLAFIWGNFFLLKAHVWVFQGPEPFLLLASLTVHVLALAAVPYRRLFT